MPKNQLKPSPGIEPIPQYVVPAAPLSSLATPPAQRLPVNALALLARRPEDPNKPLMETRDKLLQSRERPDAQKMETRDALLRTRKIEQLQAEKARIQAELDQYLIEMEGQ